MICADFLAGANLDGGNPDVLFYSMSRFFRFLPGQEKQRFVAEAGLIPLQHSSQGKVDPVIPSV